MTDIFKHLTEGGLTPEEANKAIANSTGKIEILPDAYFTLMTMFVFRDAPEGPGFWYDIAERIDE